MDFDTNYDNRIAFLSVDNAIELAVRMFLRSGPRYFSHVPTRRELQRSIESFSAGLRLAIRLAPAESSGIRVSDIEYYHRIRNRLYHDGLLLSVDRKDLLSYFRIAVVLLKNLLGSEFDEDSVTLRKLRQDVYRQVENEVRAERKALHSKRVKEGMKAAGRERVGAPRKTVSNEEISYARRRLNQGIGIYRITNEINEMRGAFRAATLETRRRLQISEGTLRRRLKERGIPSRRRRN